MCRFSFVRQTVALTKKHCIVFARNPGSAAVRLLSTLIWFLLGWLIFFAVNALLGSFTALQEIRTPAVTRISGIPTFNTESYVSFLYAPAPNDEFSPASDALTDADYAAKGVPLGRSRGEMDRAHAVVRKVMQSNKGKALLPEDVLGFREASGMDAWLVAHPEKAWAGVELMSPSPSNTTFVLLLNATKKAQEAQNSFQGPVEEKIITAKGFPMQIAFTKAIAEVALGRSLTMDVGVQHMAHPNPFGTFTLRISEKLILPTFFILAVTFPFTMQMADIVYEREIKVHQALRSMGMLESSYWASWHVFHAFQNLLIAFVYVILGLIMQFVTFKETHFLVLWLTVFFFMLSMQGFAYLCSTILNRASRATLLGVMIFFLSLIATIVVQIGIPYGGATTWLKSDQNFYMNCTAAAFQHLDTGALTPCDPNGGCDAVPEDHVVLRESCSQVEFNNTNYTRAWVEKCDHACLKGKGVRFKGVATGLAFFPPVLFCKGMLDMAYAADNETWGFPQGHYGIQLHNVSSYCQYNDTSKDAMTACDPMYSVGSSWGIFFGLYLFYSLLALYFQNVFPDNMGVRQVPWYFLTMSYWELGTPGISQKYAQMLEASEDDDVKAEEALISERTGQPMHQESAIEIRGLRQTFTGSLFARKINHAVKCPQFAMKRSQLFCLLGPNGAGKTTIINMLTGVLPPTAGEALIYDQTVTHPAGMAKIRRSMGVCPQFDILWNNLTAKEHLEVFGAVKGMPFHDARQEGMKRLEEVRLSDEANNQAGSFSGGMKRRLSVAIALIGEPSVIFLDEPTTGMDPISRRQVWDVIEAVKQDRCVVLTTHSMEEADILGDRIGIMAKGRLRCLGGGVHLKSKFGAGYQISVLAPDKSMEAIKNLFKEMLGVEAAAQTNTHVSFNIDPDKEKLMPPFFDAFDQQREALEVESMQVAMSTLEDVFLNIAKQAEVADQANKLFTVKTPVGQVEATVTMGDTQVLEVSGERFYVVWGIDEAGNYTPVDVKTPVEGAAPVTPAEGSTGAPVAPAEVAVDAPVGLRVEATPVVTSDEELQRRREALSAGFVPQVTAILYKTVMLMYMKKGVILGLIILPIVMACILLIPAVIIAETDDDMLSQRCPYCGPADDAFGKTYCGGRASCTDFFFPDDMPEAVDTRVYSIENRIQWQLEVDRCNELSKTCVGNGNLSCYMPDSRMSKGSSSSCNFFAFERLADNSTRTSASSPVVPLAHAYSPAQLASEPVAFAAPESEASQIEEALKLATGRGLPAASVRQSTVSTIEHLWTILALPGLGCGGVFNQSYFHHLNTTVQENICGLLQHGQSLDIPCCVDMLPDGVVDTFSDSAGTITSSGRGTSKLVEILKFVFGESFSDALLLGIAETGITSPIPFTCVRPRYSPEVAAKIPSSRRIGLEEGLAVIAQTLTLNPQDVYPLVNETSVPQCTLDGTCLTHGGRWAQTCDVPLYKMGWYSISQYVPCGDGVGQMPCMYLYSMFMPNQGMLVLLNLLVPPPDQVRALPVCVHSRRLQCGMHSRP
mmetsp:Transcript_15168/g.38032  ORF Transcript_15168/g.38032 Transcript_15168/m.38032 type:complete len:1527 (+) Transcript_15168:237-4817(+)